MSENFELKYTGDNTDLVGKTNVVIRSLRLLDSIADRLLPKLKALFPAAARSAATAARRYNEAAAAIKAVEAAAAGATPALQGLKQATGGIPKGVDRATSSLGGLAAQMMALHAARAVFGEILNASKELEEHWRKMAAEATEFRDSLRELANVNGKPGVGNDVTADLLDLALGMHKTPEKAREVAQGWANFAPAVRDKGHVAPAAGTKEDLEKAIVIEAGRTATRFGLGEKAAGDALGSVGLFHKITSKEDAMEQVGGALQGLARGSVQYTPGINALNKAAAKLVGKTPEDRQEMSDEGALPGRIGSYSEAGVFLGAMSLGTGGKADPAAHRMVQISWVLHPDPGKRPGAAEALKEAGVTPEMNDPDAFIRLTDYFREKKISDPTQWLSAHNLGSDATRASAVAGMKQAGVLRGWLKESRESQKTNATGKAVIADNERFIATDRTATASAVAGVESVMNKVEGIEGPEELEKGTRAADQRMRLHAHESEYYSFIRRAGEYMNTPWTLLTGGVFGHGDYLENQPKFGAIPTLKAQGQKVGVDVERRFPEIASGDYQARARAFALASEAVKAKGGDPLGLKDLSAEAGQRVNATRGDTVPVNRGAVAPPVGGAGGGAVGAGGGPAGTDPKVVNLQQQQLDELRKLNAKVGGAAARPPAPRGGPLPVDAPAAGPARRG